jgi:putative membrane protein
MSPERRLHPAGIAVYALSALREAAVPLMALFGVALLGGGFDEGSLARGGVLAIVGTVFATIAGVWRWDTTRYWVTDDGIHHKRGVVSIKETDVPLSRIQALDLEQGPVQRLFGVHAVHVQTGGGGARGEIVLEAVGPKELRELQALVGRPPARPAAIAERHLSRRMLLVAALTAGQLGLILPALAGAGQLLETAVGNDVRGVRERIEGFDEVVLAVAALLGAAWLLSVAGAVVAFAGFTAAREGDRVRIRRGLVQRREATIPVARVRAVKIVEGVLRRPLGLAALRIEVIGHAKEHAAAQTLFPLLRRTEVRPLLDQLLPELADDVDGLESPPRRALRRYVLPPAAAGLAAGAAAWALAPVGAWPLLAAVPAGAYGALRFGAAGWRLEDGRLAIRSLLLARTTVLAPAAHRESHAIAQTILQRRGELADVEVAFGKATEARVRHLEAATATELWERLSAARGAAAPLPPGGA